MLLAKLVDETLESEDVVRTREVGVGTCEGAVLKDVVVESLSGDRGDKGLVVGGLRWALLRVEFEAVDLTDAAVDRTDETEGANDLGRPAGGERASGSAVLEEAVDTVGRLGAVAGDPPADCLGGRRAGDLVDVIEGAAGRLAVLTEVTDDAIELRLDAKGSRGGLVSSTSILAAFLLSTLALNEGAAMLSTSRAVRSVPVESLRDVVFRFWGDNAVGGAARSSSTGTSSSVDDR